MFKDDLELREKVFRKMNRLAYFWTDEHLWSKGESAGHLPPIEKDWQVTAEYLVPFMRGRGWMYSVFFSGDFCWEMQGGKYQSSVTEITNDNIARAACEAFLRVEL